MATIRGLGAICPKGHSAPIVEGSYEMRDGILTVYDKPGGRPVVDMIREMAQAAIAGKADPEQTIKAIEALAPGLAPILKAAGGNNKLLALGLLLWFIVEMTKAFNASGAKPSVTDNRPTVINQITIQKGVAAKPKFAPANRRVHDDKRQQPKTKKRTTGKFHPMSPSKTI